MSTTGLGLQPIPLISTEQPKLSRSNDRKLRWLELGLITLICIVPLWVMSTRSFLVGGALGERNSLHYALSCLQEVSGLVLLCYVLYRSNRRFNALGIHLSWGGLGVGVLVWISANVVTRIAYYSVQYVHAFFYLSYVHPRNMSGLLGNTSPWIWFPFLLLNPWFEEVLVRGYVMTEVRELSGSTTLAVVASVVLQTGYHLYQGIFNACMVGIYFLVFSLYYARNRRLFPIVVAHTMMDVLAGLSLFYWAHSHLAR